jgi:hypothetical protein
MLDNGSVQGEQFVAEDREVLGDQLQRKFMRKFWSGDPIVLPAATAISLQSSKFDAVARVGHVGKQIKSRILMY